MMDDEPFSQPTARQKLSESKSAIVFKGAQADLSRIQSVCDNIVDILANLEKIDAAAMKSIGQGNRDGGLGEEDHIYMRTLKIVSITPAKFGLNNLCIGARELHLQVRGEPPDDRRRADR